MKKILLIGIILNLFILIGCAIQQQTETQKETGITKNQAEDIAEKWVKGQGAKTYEVLTSYIEGNFWKVQISTDGETGIVEINKNTGKVECLVDSTGNRDCYG